MRRSELAARYPWPGNVRELENRILQAVILCDGAGIGARDLALDVAAARAAGAGPAGGDTEKLGLEQLEKRHIERILASEGGSLAKTARRLGIGRNTLGASSRSSASSAPAAETARALEGRPKGPAGG